MKKQFRCVITNANLPYDKRNVLVCIQRNDPEEIKKIERGMFGNVIEVQQDIDSIEISTKKGTIKNGKLMKEGKDNEVIYIGLK